MENEAAAAAAAEQQLQEEDEVIYFDPNATKMAQVVQSDPTGTYIYYYSMYIYILDDHLYK